MRPFILIPRKHKCLGADVFWSSCAHCSVTPKWSFQKLWDAMNGIVTRWENSVECLCMVSGSHATLGRLSGHRVITRRQSYMNIILTFKFISLCKKGDFSAIHLRRNVHPAFGILVAHLFHRLSWLHSGRRVSFTALEDIVSAQFGWFYSIFLSSHFTLVHLILNFEVDLNWWRIKFILCFILLTIDKVIVGSESIVDDHHVSPLLNKAIWRLSTRWRRSLPSNLWLTSLGQKTVDLTGRHIHVKVIRRGSRYRGLMLITQVLVKLRLHWSGHAHLDGSILLNRSCYWFHLHNSQWLNKLLMRAVTYLFAFFFGFHLQAFKQILVHHLLVFHNRLHIFFVMNLDLVLSWRAFDCAHSRRHVIIRWSHTFIFESGSDILFICHNYHWWSHSSTPWHLFGVLYFVDPVEQCFIVHHVLNFFPLLLIKFDAVLYEVGEHLSFFFVAVWIHEGMPWVSRWQTSSHVRTGSLLVGENGHWARMEFGNFCCI